MHGLPGLLCYVQSPHSSPAVLNEAMEAFLADFNQVLEQLSEDEFYERPTQCDSANARGCTKFTRASPAILGRHY